MKTPEELAKETLQKKLKFSPDTWTDCHTCFVYGYDAAKPEWISVHERLPEEDTSVLAFVNYIEGKKPVGQVTLGAFRGGLWLTLSEIFAHPLISHWMPLPTAPEE